MTETSDTKQEILNVSLNLFSTQGYEATSVSQIAEAVGIRKASLYSHFASKQAILDELMKITLGQYERHSIFINDYFGNADVTNADITKDKEDIAPDKAIQMIVGQIRYILQDQKISRGRKMLTIEQFRNSQMAAFQTKQNYTEVMQFFTDMIRYLIGCGRLKNGEVEIMAAQLCLPISVWINLCDREPKRIDEVMSLVERHVRHFFKIYGQSLQE